MVAVAEVSPPAKLPDIPSDVDKCLNKSADKEVARGKTADDAAKIASDVDAAKLSCWKSYKRWHKKQQDGTTAVAAKAVAKEKAEPVKAKASGDKPKATWE